MPQHYIKRCSCGAVIAQCRCPSTEKQETVVQNGCQACQRATTEERPA